MSNYLADVTQREDVTVAAALDIIGTENGLAKTIPIERIGAIESTSLLKQLANPKQNRPIKQYQGVRDRTHVYDSRMQRWIKRTANGSRGLPKAKNFTKKTSVTLLPTTGKMKLFSPVHQRFSNLFGMIFDLRACDLKNEKYIFPENACTDDRWWLGGSNMSIPKNATLEQLRERNRLHVANNHISNHNELLAGLSKKSVTAVFALNNDFHSRLTALIAQERIRKELGLVVPVLIITSTEGVVVYNKDQQLEDLAQELRADGRQFAKDFSEDIQNYVTQYHAKKDQQFMLANPEVASCFKEFSDFTQEEKIQLSSLPLPNGNQLNNSEALQKKLMAVFWRSRQNNIAKIKTALQYMALLDPSQINLLFNNYGKELETPIVAEMIPYIRPDLLEKYSKIVSRKIFGEYDAVLLPEEKISNWSFLVDIVLLNSAGAQELVFKHHPQAAADILISLIQLHKISKNNKECFYREQTVKDAIAATLLTFGNDQQKHHTINVKKRLSYQVTRIIESSLLEQIKELKTKEEAYAFYAKHGDAFYLNNHRNPICDRLRGVLFPTVKVTVLRTLASHLTSLPEKNNNQPSIDQSIVAPKNHIIEWLKEMQKKLTAHATRAGFFVSHPTQKNTYITATIGELEKITTTAALRFFVGTLLVNDRFMALGRKSGCKKIQVTLKEFYDDALLSGVTQSNQLIPPHP